MMMMTHEYRSKVNDLKESIKKIQWEISNVRARMARRYNGLELSRARDEEEETESFRIKSMDAELEREEHFLLSRRAFLLQKLTRALETQSAHLAATTITRHSIVS